ncbi:MAG: choice-of-anchor Q domain-containing protein [Thermodesulfobacteriota bacterium]
MDRRHASRRRPVLIAPASAALAGAALAAAPALAVTLCVNPGGTGGCAASVQAAVDAAPRGATIEVAPGTYVENVVLAARTSLTIAGAGGGATVIDGNGAGRVVDVQVEGTRLTLAALTLTNGVAIGGGCLFVPRRGNVTVREAVIADCDAGAGRGGGILVAPRGRLTLEASTVQSSSADEGGGIAFDHGPCPSGLGTCGNTRGTIVDSTIAGNSITGAFGAGISAVRSQLRLWDSVVTGNAGVVQRGAVELGLSRIDVRRSTIADNPAGGVSLLGARGTIRETTVSGNGSIASPPSQFDVGGIHASDGPLRIERSTISGNVSPRGAGIRAATARLTVTSSTIADNEATDEGGGVLCEPPATSCPRLEATIVADNSAPAGPDCSGQIASRGNNLVEDTTGCGFTPAATDQTAADPLLGPLQANGGPTETHALLAGSPAAGAITVARLCRLPDQRGVARSVPCDVGAFEAP